MNFIQFSNQLIISTFDAKFHGMKSSHVYYFCLALLFATACAEIKPIAPAVESIKPAPKKQEISVINVPIEVELKPYFKQADESVPKKLKGKEENCEGTSYSYVFERSPIQFNGKGNQLQFDVDGKYALNINYCPKCTDVFSENGNCISPRIYASCGVGEPMRKITITYATQVELLPNYQLKSKTKLKEAKTIDKCEVTFLNFDATERLMVEVEKSLKALASDIDKQVSETAIRSEVQKAWDLLSTPLKIDKYGYLMIQPEGLSVSEFQLNGSVLKFSIAIEAFPKIQLSKPNLVTKTLPELTPYTPQNGFNIHVDLVGNYDSLSRLLSSELKGKEIEIKRNKIILDSAKIFGSANKQISFEVSFSGKRKGILYLKGTPVFNPKTQEISFPDLTFDLETKNALLKSAKWIFNDKITQTIRTYSTYNLSVILKETQDKLELELNRKLDEKTSLAGKISKLQVDGIFPVDGEILIRTSLFGTINLRLD